MELPFRWDGKLMGRQGSLAGATRAATRLATPDGRRFGAIARSRQARRGVWPAPGERRGSVPRTADPRWIGMEKTASCAYMKNLSSGTPRPGTVNRKGLFEAGLLALGSARFAGLPGRIQWLEWAKRSPITVAGAAPE
jgi:hypothetical protein